MAQTGVFLPGRFRPQPPVRRKQRRPKVFFLRLAVAVVLLLPAVSYFWRIDSVDLSGAPDLPPCVRNNLNALEGTWIPGIDLQRIRGLVDCWPGVKDVEIGIRLPGCLWVRTTVPEIRGCLRVGRTWHAVYLSGRIGNRIDTPVDPVLRGFSGKPREIRKALKAGEWVSGATGGRVLEMRWITPEDLKVVIEMAGRDRPLILDIFPEESPAETGNLQEVVTNPAVVWADLRMSDRIVIRELM